MTSKSSKAIPHMLPPWGGGRMAEGERNQNFKAFTPMSFSELEQTVKLLIGRSPLSLHPFPNRDRTQEKD